MWTMPRQPRYKNLDLPQLRSFVLVAAEGSYASAARVLDVSTPAVWEQVHALERHLGVRLFRKRGRATELTAEGQMLAGLVKPHLSGLDSLAGVFQMQRMGNHLRFTVAATDNLLTHHLPVPVETFTRAHPDIHLNLRAGLWTELLRLVEQGEAELGIAPVPWSEQRRFAALDYEHLFDMALMLLTPKGHPLAHKKKLRPQDLVKYPIILYPDETHDFQILDRILRRDNLQDRVRPVMISRGVSVTRPYVARGLGISLAHTGRSLAQIMPELDFRVFDPKLDPLPIMLVSRKGTHLPAPVGEFQRMVRAHFADPANH
jgi:DNA-binding transcriptional LysR family regulator